MSKDLQDNDVVMSNQLVEAIYKMSALEHRILQTAISQIDKNEELSERNKYLICISDIADLIDSNNNALYKRLHDAAFQLKLRQVWIPCPVRKNRTILTNWIQSVDYADDFNSHIEIQFTTNILPHITNLTKEFTMYKLKDVSNLSSFYAVRFYALFMQWKSVGSRYIKIDWLRKVLMLEDKYATFKDLRKYVIEPAIKQINELTHLNVKYEYFKSGRSVTHCNFNFTLKAKEAKPMDKKPVQAQKTNKNVTIKDTGNGPTHQHPIWSMPLTELEKYRKPGESTPALKKRLSEEGIDQKAC